MEVEEPQKVGETGEKEEVKKLTEEEKKYVKVYPIYLNKDIKYENGRKINLELCVEKPDSMQIMKVCKELLGLTCILQPNSHPKDWEKMGRVLVQIKDKEGKLIKEDIKNSKKYLII